MIPMEKWGRDHWSTFAYIETVCVDGFGAPELRKVQCNIGRHPELIYYMPMTGEPQDGTPYPIRLADGETVQDYDEWDCIDDMVVEGLLLPIGSGLTPRFKMTDKGMEWAGRIRAHKAAGGSFSTFAGMLVGSGA